MLDCVCHLHSKGGSEEGEGGAHAVTFKATHQGLVTECRCFRHVDVGEMLKTLPTIFFFYSDLLWRRNGGRISWRGSVVAVEVVEVVFAQSAVGEGAGRGGVGFSGRGRGVGSRQELNGWNGVV